MGDENKLYALSYQHIFEVCQFSPHPASSDSWNKKAQAWDENEK